MIDLKKFHEKQNNINKELIQLAIDMFPEKNLADRIFIYGNMEGMYFYNVLFEYDNQIFETVDFFDHVGISRNIVIERIRNSLREGGHNLIALKKEFLDANQQPPESIKLIYTPATGQMSMYINYDKVTTMQYIGHDDFLKWKQELNDETSKR
ncbi:DUF600 family protein [Listeria monocytogenes]|uniref:immunity protein YezG family protein n=1 Tax=Listeria monocytogenes TaxID=1639 RepID=UPI0010D8EB83|nr:immunity protein YezG family protein [Listeria monocytogenes]EAD2655562.1 DUF600 family protein [Listeria monocytogenes]TYU88645.1 DUF600 family protein [Listeria monocytogenes]